MSTGAWHPQALAGRGQRGVSPVVGFRHLSTQEDGRSKEDEEAAAASKGADTEEVSEGGEEAGEGGCSCEPRLRFNRSYFLVDWKFLGKICFSC